MTVVTALATLFALMVNVGVAPAAAEGAGIDTAAWRSSEVLSLLAGAWLKAFLASVVWGVIGLALALVTRSSAIAISVGAGWVLLVESIVATAFDRVGTWLPGTVLTAVAGGGNASLDRAAALVLAAVYVVLGLGAATLVATRRDVTD